MKDIAINESTVVVRRSNGSKIEVKRHEYDVERDFYIVFLKNKLSIDEELVLEIG
jgi:hypothetical protein